MSSGSFGCGFAPRARSRLRMPLKHNGNEPSRPSQLDTQYTYECDTRKPLDSVNTRQHTHILTVPNFKDSLCFANFPFGQRLRLSPHSDFHGRDQDGRYTLEGGAPRPAKSPTTRRYHGSRPPGMSPGTTNLRRYGPPCNVAHQYTARRAARRAAYARSAPV